MVDQLLQVQNPHWTGRRYSNLINRHVADHIIENLDMKEAVILVGIRRSGKSTVYKLVINKMIDAGVNPKTILILNYDEPAFTQYANPLGIRQLIEQAEKLTGQKVKYLFLDEIQNVEQWEKFVKISYDTEVYEKIFITGSNAKILESQYITKLSGRYLSYEIKPLSIAEIYEYKGWSSLLDLLENKPAVMSLIDDLLVYGSFPQVYKTNKKRQKEELIKVYYETILLKDCIYLGQIRDPKYFRYLTYYILTNATTLQSYRSLAKATQSNDVTVKNYVQILEDSFMIRVVENWSSSQRMINKMHKKIYAADNGLVSKIGFSLSQNRGKLLEHLVYTELSKQGQMDIYYLKDPADVDFIVKRGTQIEAIQVTYELNDHSRDREINNLLKIKSQYGIDRLTVITYDQKIDHDDIRIIPVWQYFVGI